MKYSKAIIYAALIFLLPSVALADGYLRVNGKAGAGQVFSKVKAFKCRSSVKNSCDNPFYLNLNEAMLVTDGFYFLGFENTLASQLYEVRGGRTTDVYLTKLDIPSSVRGSKTVKVYRDFSDSREQEKIYSEYYYLAGHFFRLEKETFGDFYLASLWAKDYAQKLNPSYCKIIHQNANASKEAQAACQIWNQAYSPFSLAALFEFDVNKNTFTEQWVSEPGDVMVMDHARYLVSAPVGSNDFVSVFSGTYRFVGSNGKTQSLRAP